MNNEIGRKLTSLTLMTILLAWGYSAFAPGVMPEASAANANLFVSAENSQFQNYFAGPMVIEVVIIDSSLADTDEAKGEPDVTVNGNKLRMIQATDGNWYAYFADRTQARIADQTVVDAIGTAGNGLDFGGFCSNAAGSVSGLFTQTVGVAVARSATGATNGTAAFIACTSGALNDALQNNVVRENKTVNTLFNNLGLTSAQINLWPIIQLYDFTVSGNVVVQYNKGGGVQSTTLTFDTVEGFIGEQLDRNTYPQGAQVHYTITDIGLNIDPTDEDSWTFQANSSSPVTAYQVFDENGNQDGDAVAGGVIDITDSLGDLMVEDGFQLSLNVDTQNSGTDVVTIQDNADVVLEFSPADSTAAEDATTTGSGTHGFFGINTIPITLTENGPNTAVFSTFDETDASQILITDGAKRGTSATITYDDPLTILVGFGFATIDIQPTDAEWNSGQEIPVVLTDSDANKNSRADEDLDFNNADVALIPALSIGDPFTLGEAGVESAVTYKVAFTNITDGSGNDAAGRSDLDGTLVDQLAGETVGANMTVQKFSERGLISGYNTTSNFSAEALIIDLATTFNNLDDTIKNPQGTASTTNRFHGFNLLNIDLRGLNSTIAASDVWLLNTTSSGIITRTAGTGGGTLSGEISAFELANATSAQQLFVLNRTSTAANDANTNADIVVANIFSIATTNSIGLLVNFSSKTMTTDTKAIGIDFFSFGFFKDGLIKSDRVNNYIARIEAEETGDNTGVFEGSLEFVMVNQLNILDASTYSGLSPFGDDPSFIAHQDLDAEEAPRVSYNDLGADGVTTQISDQQDAPAHSGVVSFDKPTYKIADTVTVTLQDQDLNTDVDLIDIFTVVNKTGDVADSLVGKTGLITLSTGEPLGRLLDITFDDIAWVDTNDACSATLAATVSDVSLRATGFTLRETGPATGLFTGDFQVPAKVCRSGVDTSPTNTQGLDMEVNYVDFRDASGQIIEVGDGAGIRANTGSISLDRTVYPIPWGDIEDFASSTSSTPGDRSLFPLHLTAIVLTGTGNDIDADETLGDGVLTIHVQVNDPDFDVSAAGEDFIAQNTTDAAGASTARGPVKITISRGVSKVTLGFAGGDTVKNGVIDVGDNSADLSSIRQLGPIAETTPSSGIFEFDLDIEHTDGPASETCPPTTSWTDLTVSGGGQTATESKRFDLIATTGDYCVLQGDIITVEYTDPADASGDTQTVTDSATFDLRNGALQSDKSVYIIGSDMILTLIDPDLDLDNDLAETYNLDLIEWDSDAATTTMGQKGSGATAFDPEPSNFRETGDSTGIFQVVIEIPNELGGDGLERGEEIVLEYTDWGPSGADFVGQEDEDINLTIFTSNFGATVELDQKVYTWTDKVYITVVAPDHNFDSNLIDEIGESSSDPLRVSTRGQSLNLYKLVETSTDTGIFTGEVILTGFKHDADGDGDDDAGLIANGGNGPTDGFLKADDDDGLTISYEFSEDETIVGSALIRWNIGEVSWLEASYPASGTGVVRVIDPDMNLNPEAVDNFNVDAWSDSDSGGIDLTVTETNEATGIFEGTVSFTTTDDSSGHRLRVAEGDTVTAEYEDHTLPDPYTRADELDITATAFIGTVVPPLERAPASNARVVDAFGNTLDEVSVDQQVQITADLTNGQDRDQPFAYLVQIQDDDGVTVSLAWITGSLSAGQSFSPALSWIPTSAGTYTATVFVWESVDNPTALSPPVSVDIDVS